MNLKNKRRRDLRLFSRGMVEIYAIIAIIIVVIPELIAELSLSAGQINSTKKISIKAIEWESETEFQISAMRINELRELARNLNILGYSADSRETLTRRLSRSMRRKWKQKI